VADSQILAELNDRVERFDGKVHFGLDRSAVWELDAEDLMNWSKVKQRICLDPILIKGRASAGQPNVAVWPPEGVVGPVQGEAQILDQLQHNPSNVRVPFDP
jgi:hypothetical protein